MKFAAQGWLWLLLLAPLAYALLAWDERRRLARFERFASRSVWPSIAPAWRPGLRIRKARLWCAALFFAVLAAARPQWGTHQETVNLTGMDIVVALDVSNSMEVEDVVPSRLMKARHLVRTLLEQLRGDRVGVVAFAESAYLASPLTSDLSYILETVKILGPKSVTNQGTNLGAAIETAQKALERAAEQGPAGGDASAQPQGSSKVILVISDGEDLEGKGQEAAAKLPERGIRLFAIGVGTQKGGPIPVRDPNGNLISYKRDRKGESVISRFDPEGLTKAARAGRGNYWSATSDEKEVLDFVLELGALNRSDYGEKQLLVHEERFQYPLAVAVLLLLWEMCLGLSTRPRASSSSPPSAASRSIVPLAALALGGLLAAPAARAVSLDVYRYNKKGMDAYKQGDFGQAKKDFGSAQALDPNRPELTFNRGVVQMGQGDVEGAVESFREAARQGYAAKDDALLGKSMYNLGGALAQKGDFAGAAKSYLGALNAARKGKDAALEQDIRKNLELLEKQKQQQKQQQSSDSKENKDKQDQQKDRKDQKDKQGQDDKDKDKQDQQNKDDKDKKDNKDPKDQNKDGPPPPVQQGQKQKFKSSKLTPEDADRVMSELKGKEMELRSKLRKQSGKQNPNEKDW